MIPLLITANVMLIILLLLHMAFLVWRWRYRFDAGRVADVMAADLIEKYQDDIYQLSEDGVKKYATQRYMEIAASVGLPSAPADFVANRAWDWIAQAQGEQPTRTTVRAIYD